MMVENVDYDSLTANETLMDSFKLACAEAVATQAGEGISASDVEVTVIDGSVIVVALIKVPDSIDVSSVTDNLGSFDALAAAVVQSVKAVPGIANVQTGDIGVIQTTTTTLASNEAAETTSAGIGLVLIVLAIICVGGVCGAVLARMTRTDLGRATPIEFLETSPRSSAGRVTEKLKLSGHADAEEDPQMWATSRETTPGGTRAPGEAPATLPQELPGAQSGLRLAAAGQQPGAEQDLIMIPVDGDTEEADCAPLNGTGEISAEGTGSTVDGVPDEVVDNQSRMPSLG